MRLPRGPDDADVIRARLRAMLDERAGSGWVPEDLAAPSSTARNVDIDDPPDVAPGPDVDRADLPSTGRHRAAGPVVRVDPGRRGARALWLAAGAAVLVLLLVTWWDRPTAAPVVPAGSSGASATGSPGAMSASAGDQATLTPATVVVSVVGRVSRPGLVTLPEGSRVADAVDAAGGLLPGADATGVNLAALLADGQQVAVGVPGAVPQAGPGSAPAAAGGAIDLNRAAAAQLEDLPGVGPVLAQRIVDHRERNGPFAAVEDLQDVPGIGPAILDGLADAATV